MKRTLVRHVKVQDGALFIRPAGDDAEVVIPLNSIRDVKLPFGRAIIRTDHSRHDLSVTNLSLKELDELKVLLARAVNENKLPKTESSLG